MNLMLNAQQAMPAGGELLIRTQVGKTGKSVYIRDIADTGLGIVPEKTCRGFYDAYFTTKRAARGLGLPTTRRIIEEHRGNITVTSHPGQGTNFRVELPVATQAGGRAEENADAE